jgi:hypothetical protein
MAWGGGCSQISRVCMAWGNELARSFCPANLGGNAIIQAVVNDSLVWCCGFR